MNSKLRRPTFLIVDPCQESAEVISSALRVGYSSPFDLVTLPSLAAVETWSARNLNVSLALIATEATESPETSGIAQLQRLLPSVPIVAISETADQARGLQAVSQGAQDCFPRDKITPEALSRVVKYGIERHQRMRFERELKAAEAIQMSLLPNETALYPGLQLATSLTPAGMGSGDYFDHFRLPNGNLALAVGDVSGHGMSAAFKMVEIRTLLRSFARNGGAIAQLLSDINRFLLNESASVGNGASQFVTLFVAEFDLLHGTIEYAAAGHTAMIVRSSGHGELLPSTGLPLGIMDLPIESGLPVQLGRGDILFLGTDGIDEAPNRCGGRFGLPRVLKTIADNRTAPAAKIVQTLVDAVRVFQDGVAQCDDITMILTKVTEKPRLTNSRERNLLPVNRFRERVTPSLELAPELTVK